jgi:hypothetical protein
VEDKRKTSDFSIVLGAGLEKRRGKGRVQGVYGAMVNILMGNSTQKMTYGNKMDTGYYFIGYSGLYPDTNNISFHRGAISTNGSSWSGSSWSTNRVTSTKDGFQFGIGANVFLGVEYFFAPKMSLGGEFSWGFLFSTTGQSTTEGERIKTNTTPDGSTYHTVSSYEEKAAGSSFFGIDNSNTYGAINLTFYF